MDVFESMKQRYATKRFTKEKIPKEKINMLQEMIRLAPSSFGLQPYKIIVVTDAKTKAQLQKASWDQEQITTCSHLFAFCADTNISARIQGYEKLLISAGMNKDQYEPYLAMMRQFEQQLTPEQKLTWAQKQVYLAGAHALLGATALGFASCPMEGFLSQEYAKILSLPSNLVPTLVIPVGYPADTPKPKLRFNDLFIEP